MNLLNKNPHSQLELFSELENAKTTQGASSSHPFLNFLWDYEKIIMLIIGFVITAVIAYSFGVAKGKRYSALGYVESQRPAQRQIPVHTQPQPRVISAQPEKSMVQAAPQPINLTAPAAQTASTRVPITETAAQNPAYTIQVATFKSKGTAKQVAEAFRKKGYKVSTSGTKKGYYIVSVGGFVQKEKAQTVLTEIKKQYTDSFIRRL